MIYIYIYLKIKRQATEWKDYFAIHNFIKRFTSRICKESKQNNIKNSIERDRTAVMKRKFSKGLTRWLNLSMLNFLNHRKYEN